VIRARGIACVSLVAALGFTASCRLDARDDYLGDKDPKHFELGRTPPPDSIAAVDLDVSPSGVGLPAGSGTVEQGAVVYAASCAVCHGANGEGKPPYPQLIGGPKNVDFSTDPKIPRTIGNYWPYATTLFDYVRRAMPLTSPGSLSADQTYAVTAYLLSRDGVIPATAQLDARSLPAVQMPAKARFVNDDRRGSTGGKTTR
jgi:cytochrome c